jgi:hypothetical protein
LKRMAKASDFDKGKEHRDTVLSDASQDHQMLRDDERFINVLPTTHAQEPGGSFQRSTHSR